MEWFRLGGKSHCYFTGLVELKYNYTRHFLRLYLKTTDAGKITLPPSIKIEVLC